MVAISRINALIKCKCHPFQIFNILNSSNFNTNCFEDNGILIENYLHHFFNPIKSVDLAR